MGLVTTPLRSINPPVESDRAALMILTEPLTLFEIRLQASEELALLRWKHLLQLIAKFVVHRVPLGIAKGKHGPTPPEFGYDIEHVKEIALRTGNLSANAALPDKDILVRDSIPDLPIFYFCQEGPNSLLVPKDGISRF